MYICSCASSWRSECILNLKIRSVSVVSFTFRLLYPQKLLDRRLGQCTRKAGIEVIVKINYYPRRESNSGTGYLSDKHLQRKCQQIRNIQPSGRFLKLCEQNH
jgi:hypothetical protein